MERRIVGIMTGTSIDGIDAAVVEIAGARLGMRPTFVAHRAADLGDLAAPLRRAAAQDPMSAGAFARLATDFGARIVEVVEAVVEGGGPAPDLIAVHGQTIFHQPPYSWQIVDPAPIAVRFGVPVVTDLRAADLAAGGAGAPITPLADWILYRAPGERRAIVNLGGFCNVTMLPASDGDEGIAGISGFDVCVCNQVLDAVARLTLDAPYDTEGRAAASGTADRDATSALLSILAAQRTAGRSLGTGDEAEAWVRAHAGRLPGPDLAASAVAAIADAIAAGLDLTRCDRVIVAGGGCRNVALLAALRRAVEAPVGPSDDLGLPAEAREAAAIAVLGALSADGVPITLPQVTACPVPAVLAGSWTSAGARSSS